MKESGLNGARGSVLVVVVWLLALLVVFTIAVNRQASQALLLGKWMKDRVEMRTLAKSGIERAIMEIQRDKFLAFDAPSESWGGNPDAFREISLGEGDFSVTCPVEGETSKSFRYGVCDESARINLNKASEEILATLLKTVRKNMDNHQAHGIAQSILDWIDGDSATRENGAEIMFYRSLKPPYEPRNGPFQFTEELMMVRGIDAELYRELAPYVTVYSAGKVNFNTAPPVVLEALGLDEDLAAKMIAFRRGKDLLEGTKDDEVFQIVEGITPALSAVLPFSSEEFAKIANAISGGWVGVNTDTFRIHSFGRLIRNGKDVQTRVDCIVKRDGSIVSWTEIGE